MVTASRTLLEVLREDLRLTGTKHGCELGECGACTVLIDGEPRLACMTLAVQAADGQITTIEGLADGGRLHPLQQAFVDHGAVQCGYCTGGMILTADALIRRRAEGADASSGGAPSEREVREALAGNLCRCTGYGKIVAAAMAAASGSETAPVRGSNQDSDTRSASADVTDEASQSVAASDLAGAAGSAAHSDGSDAVSAASDGFSLVGRPLPKVDALDKVTGRALYTDDLSFPDMLHAKLARCPHAHAEIVSIDAGPALEIEGVVAVITGADLPVPYGVLPVSEDEHGLSPDRGRFVGDPVAAVAAETPAAATAGVRALRVEYRVLAEAMSPEAALRSPDPIHPSRSPRPGDPEPQPNLHRAVALEFGETEGSLGAADRRLRAAYHYGGNNHMALEEHSCIGIPEAGGERLTLWSSTQTPHYVQRALAKALSMPAHLIRVRVPTLGGGFGGKTEALPHEVAAAKLALVTGRPVKCSLNREEVFYSHRGRHPVTMEIDLGLDDDGQIRGLAIDTVLDGGAYGSYGVASMYYTGALLPATYTLPAYRFRGARVYTNKPPCGPKRGHGTPQPRFGLEVLLDETASELGISPLDLRLRNLIAPHSHSINHLRITSCGLRECLEAVAEASDFRRKHGALAPGRGVGIACSSYISGAGLPVYWNDLPHTTVSLEADRTGRVTAYCGATDIGQGSDSVLATLVAEELGLRPVDVQLVTADTGVTPVDLGSYSSRVTFMMGNAAIMAARELAGAVLAAVAGLVDIESPAVSGSGAVDGRSGSEAGPGAPAVAGLALRGGHVVRAADGASVMPWPEACRRAEARGVVLRGTGAYRPPDEIVGPYKGAGVGPSPAYSYSACVVEVTVDETTGQVVPREVWLAHDGGRALNPQSFEGQIEGSVYMGLAEALMEEQRFMGALHASPSMLDYKTPTALDMPPIHPMIVRTDDPEGPYGAKEVGQGPLLPVPPAVANAVFDAVGVRMREVPITPDKVHRALRMRARGRDGAVGPRSIPPVRYPPPTRVDPPMSVVQAQGEPASSQELA